MRRRALVLAVLAALASGYEAMARGQDRPVTPDQRANYVIGPDDVLSVLFWRDKDMTADVVVRPDGKISLPLINDIQAGGLTPSELCEAVKAVARRYVEDPSVTVVVKQINSRKLFITGQVEKPGPYPMSGPTTVLQLIATAGGLKEFNDGKRILIMRTDKAGKQTSYVFNYRQVTEGKKLEQNIELRPGDTVVVP
jgi:polysaccharide export outer membrane protein